ncbi:unnamed protein product [Amoebophrya sp. A120]|nr:unnamed protein product [Amoebophrya sp. A120]|eukprot:GSA120T00009020001.1
MKYEANKEWRLAFLFFFSCFWFRIRFRISKFSKSSTKEKKVLTFAILLSQVRVLEFLASERRLAHLVPSRRLAVQTNKKWPLILGPALVSETIMNVVGEY